jgi:hypothetical protein
VERRSNEGDAVVNERRNKLRLVGVYAQHPEEMLTHAISVTLSTAAGIFGSSHKHALFTVCCNPAMLERAAKKIYSYVLHEMAPGQKREPSPEAFNQLVKDIAGIAKES